MRMCRCDGACPFTDVCVRVSPARREQLSRQEIETCLVTRARRSIHASFWVFHQPARNASIWDAAARGDGVDALGFSCGAAVPG